ncbi:MAG: hypothetical protein HDT22_06740 [Ruminococcus sp.]|nr:hypothetical protein [Ruminococcus sp.]
MNKLLKVIYNDYAERLLPENPLETPEIRNATLSFLDTYFSHMSREEHDKVFTRLIDLRDVVEENAFEVGFYAGVKLLMNRKDF